MKISILLQLGIMTLSILSCQNSQPKIDREDIIETEIVQKEINDQHEEIQIEEGKEKRIDSLSTTLSSIGLIDIQEIDPTIKVELKYATTDNFTGKQLYYVLQKAYLQKDVALQLKNAQRFLQDKHPNYALLIYDAARPVEVQQRMWDALAHVPVNERTKFVSNPKNHSIHNYGAAVDLTIIGDDGKPLDMGAKYDEIEEIAYPRLEQEFLKKGLLTEEQIKNRELLREVMRKAGFRNIATEWWHFNACTREQAKANYSVFLKEPNN